MQAVLDLFFSSLKNLRWDFVGIQIEKTGFGYFPKSGRKVGRILFILMKMEKRIRCKEKYLTEIKGIGIIPNVKEMIFTEVLFGGACRE